MDVFIIKHTTWHLIKKKTPIAFNEYAVFMSKILKQDVIKTGNWESDLIGLSGKFTGC